MATDESIQIGGLYASQSADGSWKVDRVLALDEHAVHLRAYTNRFADRPTDVDFDTLDWFIGHLPLAREAFARPPRFLIKVVPVAFEELDGYRYYLGETDE